MVPSSNITVNGVTYAAGNIYTIAGTGAFGSAGDGAAATSAQLGTITGICMDSSGRIFVADNSFSKIRMFTIGGNISTIAGTGASGYNGDGMNATSASLSNPQGVFVDSSNAVYVAESGRIRRFTIGGNISTIAGTGSNGYNGEGVATSFWTAPQGIYVDSTNTVYVAEQLNRIRRFTVGGSTSTIAGTGSSTYFGGDSGSATQAGLSAPSNFFVDTQRNIYISDSSNRIVRMVPATTISVTGGPTYTAGNIYTIAGISGAFGFSGDGGPATSAQFGSLAGITVDNTGLIYVADASFGRIRTFRLGGNISTIAGGGVTQGDGGLATDANLSGPQNIFLDSSGGLYIAESSTGRVRMIPGSSMNLADGTSYAAGNIYTIAGNGANGFSGDGGLATSAQLNFPSDICVDNLGFIYITDQNNNRIRKAILGGNISTFAGNGATIFTGDGASATSAVLSFSYGFCLDTNGNIYIAVPIIELSA